MAEKECIERGAAIEAIDESLKRVFVLPIGKSIIDRIPAADVRPVILCRDCKHSDTFAPDCTESTFPLKCLSIRYGGVYPDWFCEHGEKREES